MNKQNFKNGNSMFPLSTDALEFMQEQTLLVARLTELAGSRVIITQPTSGKVGLCVFDGELLPLTGNTSDPRIAITEILESITAHGTTYENVRIKREAVYGTSGESVSTFVVLDNMVTLKTAIANLTSDLNTEATTRAQHDVPKGTIIDWYGTCKCDQVPHGWIPCGAFFRSENNKFNPGNDGWIEMEKWKAKYPDISISSEGVSSQERCIVISFCNNSPIPNLTDSYIVQAGCSFEKGPAGGANNVYLKPENLPPHKHNVGIGATSTIHDHSSNGVKRVESGISTLTDAAVYDKDGVIVTEGNKSATPFNNRPKSFALYKLIKVI